jgi:hypothetical protein
MNDTAEKVQCQPQREKRINRAIELMRNLADHAQKLDNRSCDIADRWLQHVPLEGKEDNEPPIDTMGLIDYVLNQIRYHIEGIDNNLTRLENDL